MEDAIRRTPLQACKMGHTGSNPVLTTLIKLVYEQSLR